MLSETKTYVGTSISRVMDDRLITTAVKRGGIKALYLNQDFNQHVAYEMFAGLGTQVERMYRYARDHYPYGLPSGSTINLNDHESVVKDVLENIEGSAVTILYSRFAGPNPLHMAWLHLIRDYAYSLVTNEIGSINSPFNTPVYLDGIELTIPESLWNSEDPEVFIQWDSPNSTGPKSESQRFGLDRVNVFKQGVFTRSLTATKITVAARYVYALPGNRVDINGDQITFRTERMELNIPEYNQDDDYFQVKYAVNGVTKYWSYKFGSGTHPSLDGFIDGDPGKIGTFFPFIYFRVDDKSMHTIKLTEPEVFAASKKMVKMLDLDYEEVIDKVHENPDVGDVMQGMLTFMVSPLTQNEVELRYLFDFFKAQYATQNTTIGDKKLQQYVKRYLSRYFNGRVSHSIVIQDKKFRMLLLHGGIGLSNKIGNIGPVGTVKGFHRKRTVNAATVVDGEGNASSGRAVVDNYTYQKQISEHTYTEVSVDDLRTIYHVKNGYSTIGDDKDKILMIPLDYSLTKKYSITDRERLYSSSMYFIFNSYVVVKLKWYETFFFEWVMAIFTAVMMVMGMPEGGLTEWLKTATVQKVATLVVKIVIYKLVFVEALKLLVDLVGVDAAIILIIAATLVGVKLQFEAGSWALLPSVKELLFYVNGLIDATQAAIADDFKDLLKDKSAFDKEVETQLQTLEDINDLLGVNTLKTVRIIPGETPTQFVDRTIHWSNPGMYAIDAIHNYVDTSLRLPTFADTMHMLDPMSRA